MDAANLKRWKAAETVMERACDALPQPADGARAEFELGLAFDALKDAATLVASRGGVWKDLLRAAEFVELNEALPDLQMRFEMSARALETESSSKELTPDDSLDDTRAS